MVIAGQGSCYGSRVDESCRARMIASLPMYDWPEIRAATDAWWAGIARYLEVDIPLRRVSDHASLWRKPSLLLSQTCGYPFTHGLGAAVQLVATPHYRAEGCEGAAYSSFIFARERFDDLGALSGAVAAVNSGDSMSGMLALKLVFGPLARSGAFFGSTIVTGGHIASMIAVRDGHADICAIDSVCAALARRYRPDYLEGLVRIARSPPAPGLPYVTSARSSAADLSRLRRSLTSAFSDPELEPARDALLLSGFSVLEPADYDIILDLERGADHMVISS